MGDRIKAWIDAHLVNLAILLIIVTLAISVFWELIGG